MQPVESGAAVRPSSEVLPVGAAVPDAQPVAGAEEAAVPDAQPAAGAEEAAVPDAQPGAAAEGVAVPDAQPAAVVEAAVVQRAWPPAAVRPSAAGPSAGRWDLALPCLAPAPQRSARSAHERRRSRAAPPSEPWWQAAQCESLS